jgi:SDR family mycofactocin-dependent oxidoreductase
VSKLEGKVALITGAARGQGRSHAVGFAREGASLVLTDICADLASVHYRMGTADELEQTIELVRAAGGDVVAQAADARDGEAMDTVVALGLERFGRIDVVCANAGISGHGRLWEISRADFDEMVSVCLTGVWETCRSALPQMIDRGEGGVLIATSSCAGLRGFPGAGHYSAAKHGVVGLMKSFAAELGGHGIRSNAVCPFTVRTEMITNELGRSLAEKRERYQSLNLLPTPWAEPEDVTALLVLLASDEGRYITGQAIAIDSGFLQHM